MLYNNFSIYLNVIFLYQSVIKLCNITNIKSI